MDTSSSSKVTVEYHDPSGVFPLIAPDIAARLPLRNLIWRSPIRPLRKINSLHLDFVPDSFTTNSLKPPVQIGDSNGTTSFDIVRSGADPRKNASKERRHQIPGLQTSPYLKLYILRADDKDSYKATERKKIREWVRDNAAASKKGKGENHEAFEWMIVHVVIPDTIASTEPRWRESASDPDELKERKQGMKLPGKSTRTVFDKLRSDFNESGKTKQDRVAQIRLTRAQVSADLLPTPAMATTIEETHDEREKAWEHLMGKIKTMILSPFDIRVRQYEADVAEQDSRRAMPGFNFCTFFIYKEGLAMAFESIGLVEDALVIYDELSLGFETVLKSMSGGQAHGTATTFAPFTADIIDRIVGKSSAGTNGTLTDSSNGSRNMGAFQKDYRERIVRSDISVFDFSCYLFARQNALILRIANAKSSRFGSRAAQEEDGEDLVLISEVCWRAANFIHNAARSLRRDLNNYRSSQWEAQVDSPISDLDIESLVSSWMYIVAGQMLHETYSAALETVSEPGRRDMNGFANGLKHPAVASLGGVSAHPQRTASLPSRKNRASELQGRDSLQSASDSDLMSPPMSPGHEMSRSTGTTAGLIELVTYRAELLMTQRKMLEQIAKQRQWVSGWALMEDRRRAEMVEVDLDGDGDDLTATEDTTKHAKPSELLAYSLASALKSKEAFHALYERLSDQAMRLYLVVTQRKRAESILGDLAILKYQQADYNYAASYFQHVLPFYAEEGWSLMEIEALRMHAMCLKELDRKEEYVVTLLALVAKACGWRKDKDFSSGRAPTFDEVADVAGVLPEALHYSRNLDVEVSNPASLYFSEIHLDREVEHYEEKDGFALQLRLRHLLDDDIQLDQIAARLVSVDDPQIEAWLMANKVKLRRGLNKVTLESLTTTFGAFTLHGIALQTNNVLFVHEPTTDAAQQPTHFLYPAQHAFEAGMVLAKHVQIDKPQYLEVSLSSGWNELQAIDLKFQPATAGLRLHLADATFDGIRPRKDNNTQGQLSLGAQAADSSALLQVPYTLEQAGQQIFIRLEVRYTTSQGAFVFLTSRRLQTRLPLDVDVNDHFRLDKLLSTFTLHAAKNTSVVVSNAALSSSSRFTVEANEAPPMPLNVFQDEPAKLLYNITKDDEIVGQVSQKDMSLKLRLEYTLVDDLVLHHLRQKFEQALAGSHFFAFSRLLLPFFKGRLTRLMSCADAERAVKDSKIHVPSFDDMGWSEILAESPEIVRSEITGWLFGWHEANVHLPLGPAPSDLKRSINIPVEIPSMDFVHNATLKIQQEEGKFIPRTGARIMELGESVKASLAITSTTLWSDKVNDKQEQDFVYDVQPDPECWLIGGPKQSHFTAVTSSEQTVEVLLIPIKSGLHTLPHVDVQVAPAEANIGGEASGKGAAAVTSETCYESATQTVQVIDPSRNTRVYIQESPLTRPASRPGSSTMAKDAG